MSVIVMVWNLNFRCNLQQQITPKPQSVCHGMASPKMLLSEFSGAYIRKKPREPFWAILATLGHPVVAGEIDRGGDL